MPIGSHLVRCHACYTDYLCGDLITRTCPDCRDKGHTDSLIDCPACEEQHAAYLAGIQLEALADLMHQLWSGWFSWMHEHYHDSGRVETWLKQAATPYALLSPEDQEKDRREARRVLALLATAQPRKREGGWR